MKCDGTYPNSRMTATIMCMEVGDDRGHKQRGREASTEMTSFVATAVG